MVVDYFSMNPQFQQSGNPNATSNKSVRPYVDLPTAPRLAINTLFRSQSQIPLPMKPPAYTMNYGFPVGKPNVSSMFGAVPHMGTPLTKIGREDFPVLEPAHLYPNLPMKC
jgi:hypothetical protein